MANREDLDILIEHLRKLHAGIESYSTTNGRWWPTKAEEWVADLWRYDHDLVEAAEVFDIPVPPRPPQDAMRRLSPSERAELERLLAEHGIDVVGDPAPGTTPSRPDQAVDAPATHDEPESLHRADG